MQNRSRYIEDLNNLNFIIGIYNKCQDDVVLDNILLNGLPVELYMFSATVPEKKNNLMSNYVKQYGLKSLLFLSVGAYGASKLLSPKENNSKVHTFDNMPDSHRKYLLDKMKKKATRII